MKKRKKKNNVLTKGSKNLDLENWRVYHPNGKHMFTCSGKKARWYLDRDLAIQIGEYEMQFTFSPNGYGFADNEEFGKSIREAKCVVTGTRDDLQRHHIVPYCYRKYLPFKYKSKNHHDVVLMNHDIHAEYEVEAIKFKDELAYKYGVRTISDYNKAYSLAIREFNKEKGIILGKINTILKGYKKIPKSLINDNLIYLANEFDISESFMLNINFIQLMKLYLLLQKKYNSEYEQFKERHGKYYDHGWHLIQKLDNDEKVEEFIKLWRRHFIDTMQPKYMPNGWSINFRCKTER
jgi:hypothetical protein